MKIIMTGNEKNRFAYNLFRILFYTGLVLMIAGLICGKYYSLNHKYPVCSFTGNFVLSMPKNDFHLNLKVYGSENQVSRIALDNDIYRNIVNNLSERSGKKLTPFIIHLYFDGFLSDSSHFKADDLKGFSAYSLNNRIYYHRLFIRDGDGFIEKSDYCCQVGGIYCLHPYLILKNILNIKRGSYLILTNRQDVTTKYHKYVKEVLIEKLEKANL